MIHDAYTAYNWLHSAFRHPMAVAVSHWVLGRRENLECFSDMSAKDYLSSSYAVLTDACENVSPFLFILY
jgi:hypothetical protein